MLRVLSKLFKSPPGVRILSGQVPDDIRSRDQEDLKELEQIEDAVFGKYRGPTDSSDLVSWKRARRPARKFNKQQRIQNSDESTAVPNEWDVQRLGLHDPLLR